MPTQHATICEDYVVAYTIGKNERVHIAAICQITRHGKRFKARRLIRRLEPTTWAILRENLFHQLGVAR